MSNVGLYEVRIFSVSENGENGLSDEGAEGAMPPRILGLEPPLLRAECMLDVSNLSKVVETSGADVCNMLLKTVLQRATDMENSHLPARGSASYEPGEAQSYPSSACKSAETEHGLSMFSFSRFASMQWLMSVEAIAIDEVGPFVRGFRALPWALPLSQEAKK